MRQLEKVKIWTGDGFGAAGAITLTQIKRTDKVAMYSRHSKEGRFGGYEVFLVKVVEAGTPLPGGGVVEESYEQYPTANRFGKIAWHIGSLGYANVVYDNLVAGRGPREDAEIEMDDTEATEVETPTVTRAPGQRGRVKGPRPVLKLPEAEFTVNEVADLNQVEYPIAFIFIKESVEKQEIKFLRTERRNARGKESSIYAKA